MATMLSCIKCNLAKSDELVEKGWYRQHPFTLLFWPLSLLYRLVAVFRRFGYQRGWFSSFAGKPVVIVGNISVGGTGKTPFTLWLCKSLTEQGFTPGIVSRGYGARITEPVTYLCIWLVMSGMNLYFWPAKVIAL